ncbi:MAG: ATP-binding cassette domain-containing protein [Magnetococcales bacterium]|nr:ATP-binding cassette domain-containing protein [Magnetococcales bacterium]
MNPQQTHPDLWRIVGLTVATPQQEILIHPTDLECVPGEIILLAGLSGVGKTTFLKALSGLLDTGHWRLAGRLLGLPQEIDLAQEGQAIGSLVFQDHALFDDLSAYENILIARDHSTGQPDKPLALLRSLLADIQPQAAVASLSGGQKQRVAIARTLHGTRPLLLLDEPNSGLDAARAEEMIQLLRQLVMATGQVAVITAHHFQALLPHVDRVWFFSRSERTIRALPQVGVAEIMQQLWQDAQTDQAARSTPQEWPELPPPQSPSRAAPMHGRWFAFFLNRYLQQLCFSPLLLVYILLGGVLAGFVSVWFSFQNLPYKDYFGEVLHDDLLAGIGYFQFRVLVPLLTALLLASRNGAIISADIGHRGFAAQFLAMRNMGIPYRLYLGGSILLATLLASGLMFLVCWFISAWISYGTWSFLHPFQPMALWKELFFQNLFLDDSMVPVGLGWVAAKMAASGLAIAVMGLLAGAAEKHSVLDINRGIAQSLIAGTSLVLMIHTIFAFIEFAP